jgi:hypothetical protein
MISEHLEKHCHNMIYMYINLEHVYMSKMRQTLELVTSNGYIDFTHYTIETAEPYMKDGIITIDTSKMKGGDSITFSSKSFTFVVLFVDTSCSLK